MTCDDLGIGVCADVDGISTCTLPCPLGTECAAVMLECTGTDDIGNAICASLPCFGAPEGAPCDIPMFGSIGTCVGGDCICTEDMECTAPGFACEI